MPVALRSALLRDGIRPHVYLGVTTQAAMRLEPGVIAHTGSGITALGRRTNPVNTQLRDIATALTSSGLQAVAVDDIHRWVWRKLAVNAAINPLTALASVQNSVISTDPGLRASAETIAREVVTVGRASGVKIDLKEVLAAIDDVARSTGDNRSSMLVDIETGTPTEIDAINGAIVSEARRHAIKVPANQLMTALVRAREGRFQSAAWTTRATWKPASSPDTEATCHDLPNSRFPARANDSRTLRRYKVRDGEQPLVMVTAYDAPTARFAVDAGVDLILVGDSVGTTLLGYDSTVPVTIEDIIHHARAVRRGAPDAHIVADLPFMTYQVSDEQAIANAGRLLKEGGADAVKLEGGTALAESGRRDRPGRVFRWWATLA